MVEDYVLLAKLRDLDEAMQSADYWLEKYRQETSPNIRRTAMRFYLQNRGEALKLMEVVAKHGRGE